MTTNPTSYTLPAGGVAMSDEGRVRFDRSAGSYYVDLWWRGERVRLYRLPILGGDMVSCKTEQMAEALQYVVNRQIDQGIFEPARFKIKRPLHMKAYATAWLEKQTHLMASAHRDYAQYINKWIIPQLGSVFINDITEGRIEEFINSLPLGPKGKQNVLGCLMKILHDAERAKDIEKAPMKPVMRGKNRVVDPEVLWVGPEEQDKILAALKPQYRPIIQFGMQTGCRPAECRALQWDDVKWSHNEILIRHAFDCYGKLVPVKGKKTLPVPLFDDTRALLEDLRGKNLSPYVFVNARTGEPFGANLCKVFARACKKAMGCQIGIAKATRTSYAQQLANGGVEIEKVRRLLRQTSSKVTKRYYEFQTEPLKSAVEKVRRIR